MDTSAARYINDNFADYLVAVNADIQELEIFLMPEQDDRVNPAGVKGLGELGQRRHGRGDRQCRLPRHRPAHSRPPHQIG
jgi:hypothetical protein